jgi:hypothetical protein
MFFRIARFTSLSSTVSGSPICVAIATFALSRAGSDISAVRSGAGTLIVVRGDAALARSVDPRLFGDEVLPGLAGVAEFDLTTAGSCANAVGIGRAGWATATLSKQGRDAHPRKYPREGANQPKPIRIPASTPTKISPIRFPSSGARLALVTWTNSALVIYLLRKSIKRPLSARRCPAHAWMGGLDRARDPCRDDRKRPIVKAIMADLVRSRTILQLASSSEGLHHQTLPIADLGLQVSFGARTSFAPEPA